MKPVKKSNSDKFFMYYVGADFSDYVILENKKDSIVLYNPKTETIFSSTKTKYRTFIEDTTIKWSFNMKDISITKYKKSEKKFALWDMGSVHVLILKHKLRKLGIKKFTVSKYLNRYILEIKHPDDAAMFRLYFNDYFK